MLTRLAGGHVIDPANGRDGVGDVWLRDGRIIDAPPHKISIAQCVAMARDFEFLVLFTSTPSLHVDIKIAERMKDWSPPEPHYRTGVMAKYARLVSSAAAGAVTN